MNKEWMHLPSRLVPEYEDGVQKFIAQARNYAKTREVILCPCKRCKNKKYLKFNEVYDHLIIKGIDPSYTTWVFHGEIYSSQSQDKGSSGGVQKDDESREAYHLYKDVFVPEEDVGHTCSETKDCEFADLLEDAETPLFPGCTTYTKLSAVVTLYNYKSTNGHTDNSFNELLKILGDMLPEKNTLPETVYSMRKLLKPFDLRYEKIHACPNDCCLFRKEFKDLDSCPRCGSSRWKVDKVTSKVLKKIPEKVLRYFPVIPRLKRMFTSKEKAEELIWHYSHKSQDHMMRHPVDSVAWDTINHKWPDFASDPRNLRLGLATDGFNPFGDLSSRYSCWPVILVNYNLPPLMCMIKENLMLTLLIPGPKQPGNDIDVYLEPLVEDLKKLWDTGVEAYDAFSKSMFNLKAILMWTINDFPAYGNLAGCATKGKLGCPICGEDVCSMWLKYSRKFAYLGHRRFLAPNHPFRQKKKWFNGKKERKGKPRPLNGLEIFNTLKDLHGKEPIDDEKTDNKKGRGASKLKMVCGQDKCIELERNELGQPIGDNSVKYASFLGCMIKEFVPYTLEGWNDIDEEVKDRMWSCLQMTYKVEDLEKKQIFQKLAKLWRDRKSKLQILVREANTSRVASRDLSLLKPEFMDQNQWDLFVKRTLSPTFQEKSARFREMRGKQDHIHTMSRRGYARLTHIMEKTSPADTIITRSQVWIEGHKKKNGEPSTQAVGEKMKEIQECSLESQNTTNIADDAISLVFGKEARGRVRGMGFGVTPSKVGASVQPNGTVKQLQTIVQNLQQEMQEMKSMFLQNMRQQNQQEQVASGGIGSGVGNEVGSNSDINIGAKKSGDFDYINKHLTTAQSNLKNMSRGDIRANTKCKILHCCVDGLVVAEGRIASTEPNVKVHHVVLGRSCWKVWVDKVLVEKVDLIRPNDEMQFLEDAIGSTIAWLSKFIVVCD